MGATSYEPAAHRAGHGAPHGEPRGEPHGEADDLEVALARRASPTRRLARAGVIALALVVALGAALRGLPWPGGASSPAVAPPSVIVTSNVSYGVVTLNGARVAGARQAGDALADALPVPVRLAAGDNVIALDAPPFLPVRCVVAGPPDAPSIMPTSLGRCAITTDRVGSVAARIVINIWLTAIDLPPDARAGAQAVVAAALAAVPFAVVDVPVGDYYATGARGPDTITSRAATEPLRAWLGVAPAPDDDDLFTTDSDIALDRCVQLGCPLPLDQGYVTPSHGWLVGEAVALDWRFTTGDGLEVGEARFSLGGIPVALVAAPGGDEWTLAADLPAGGQPFGAPLDLCQLGTQALVRFIGPLNIKVVSAVDRGQEDGENTGMAGCGLSAPTPGNRATAHFIWRFGVLLAADAAAHQLARALPLAPANEAHAVGL